MQHLIVVVVVWKNRDDDTGGGVLNEVYVPPNALCIQPTNPSGPMVNNLDDFNECLPSVCPLIYTFSEKVKNRTPSLLEIFKSDWEAIGYGQLFDSDMGKKTWIAALH